MAFRELIFLVLSDLHRYRSSVKYTDLFKAFIFGKGFKYLFWWRINKFLCSKGKIAYIPLVICKLILRKCSFRLGIEINLSANIGPGFKIEHFGNIIINSKARIGMRCSILQGVTIGEYNGAPKLGDFVFVGPGAKIIGPVVVGDNAIIGANAVLTKSIENNSVAIGIPAKVVSKKGSIRANYNDVFEQHLALYRSLCPEDLWSRYGL